MIVLTCLMASGWVWLTRDTDRSRVGGEEVLLLLPHYFTALVLISDTVWNFS